MKWVMWSSGMGHMSQRDMLSRKFTNVSKDIWYILLVSYRRYNKSISWFSFPFSGRTFQSSCSGRGGRTRGNTKPVYQVDIKHEIGTNSRNVISLIMGWFPQCFGHWYWTHLPAKNAAQPRYALPALSENNWRQSLLIYRFGFSWSRNRCNRNGYKNSTWKVYSLEIFTSY
jgi:hypothetical protein